MDRKSKKKWFGPTKIKRLFDICASFLALVVLSPLFLVICIVNLFTPECSVFFSHERRGRRGKPFTIYKFQTMKNNTPNCATGELENPEQYITKFGKFLRKTSLDELPQLINILKGDMSIVGPRPERKCLADEISKEIPEFCYRLKVRGGLTGYAQIYGKYNTSAYDKLRLDMMYIENYSPLLDIRLIILTLRIIFSKDSTEGIDVAMENQRRADELWRELDEENEEKEKGGAE